MSGLPHDMEAEQAILGACLYDNTNFHAVSPIVDADHFYNPAHVTIFKAIADLIGAGQLADAIILKNRFAKDDTLNAIGGVEYLADLALQAPPTATVPEYAKLVFDMAMRREGLRALDALHAELNDPASGRLAGASIAEGIQRLGSLSKPIGGDAFMGVGDALRQHLTRTEPLTIPFGIPRLDNSFRLPREGLTLLAGLTSHGKTAFVTQAAYNLAAQGYKVVFFSMEMTKGQVAARAVSSQLRRQHLPPVNYVKINDPSQLTERDRNAVEAEIAHLPDIKINDQARLTASEIQAYCAAMPETPDLIVIDYLNIMRNSDCDKSLRSDEKIGDICARLRAYAKSSGAAIVLLCQLNRDNRSREVKAPQLSDLKGASDLEQAADAVMFIHRASREYKNIAEALEAEGKTDEAEENWAKYKATKDRMDILIPKVRQGQPGRVNLSCEIENNWIYDPATWRLQDTPVRREYA